MTLECDFQKLSKNCSFLDFSEFSKNLHFSFFEFLRNEEGPLSNINQHINTLGVLLLKISTCCFCFQKLLIFLHLLSATKTNFVVFKQNDPQSVADLINVAGDPLIALESLQTKKNKK